jgi:predicted DCC family thiol-disulfide oxidoreductase YuxK
MRPLDKVVAWFNSEDRLVAASVLRVGLGTVLASLYLLHYPFRHFIWGPEAFVSHEMFTELTRDLGTHSLYALSDSVLGFELIFHAGLIVTLLWLTGFWTRITGVLAYVFAFSLWERNGFVLDGGDNILIICLFFLMLARTDRYLSWGSAERRRRWAARQASVATNGWARARQRIYEIGTVLHNGALVAVVIQVCFLYLTSALYKVQGEMWQSGVALYYVLRVQEFTWPGVADYVYQSAILITAFTYLTVLEQVAYPFMLLNRYTKRLSVFVVVQMHLGIALLMGLFSFSTVMITLQAAAFRDSEILGAVGWIRSLPGRVATRFALLPRRVALTGLRPAATLRERAAIQVFYDDWCPRCTALRARVERLDWLRLVTFSPIRSPEAEQDAGVPADQLLQRMHVRSVRSGRMRSGAAAMAALCARVPVASPLWPALALASSLRIGERIYDVIARNRSVVPVAACTDGTCSPALSRSDGEFSLS